MINDPTWYIDSGATSHVTNYANLVDQKMEYSGKEALMVGNGEKLHISHIGNSHLHCIKEYLFLRTSSLFLALRKI